MGDEFAILDILILLALAVFFISRLRKVLGKQIDDDFSKTDIKNLQEKLQQFQNEDPTSKEVIDAAIHQVEDDAPILADIKNPDVTQTLLEIKKLDPHFNVKEFLQGAKGAFEMIFEAYNTGDKATLKSLLSKEIFEDFALAMDERENADIREEATLIAIEAATIHQAKLQGKIAEITVNFTSEQILVEKDAEGVIVSGDPSKTELVYDSWTFERDTRSPNPNWTLVGT